jgi:hypothetical protein
MYKQWFDKGSEKVKALPSVFSLFKVPSLPGAGPTHFVMIVVTAPIAIF